MARRGQAIVSGAVACLLVVAVTVVLWRSAGPSADSYELNSGAAWFVSEAEGTAVLLDGSTGDVRAEVDEVSAPGDELEVVQAGTTAAIANRTRGALTTISAAKWKAEASIDLGTGADPSLALAGASGSQVWALTRQSSQLVRADIAGPTTLDPPVAVPDQTTPDGIAASRDGTLWVASDRGEVRSFSDAGPQVQSSPGAQGPVHVEMVKDQPVLVDLGDRRYTPIDRSSGAPGEGGPVDAPQDVAFGGSSSKPWLMAVGTRAGTLAVIDVETGQTKNFPLGQQSDREAYGAPIEAFGKVLVPDVAKGAVIVVDPSASGAPVPQTIDLNIRTGSFRLLSLDGRVYFDQPDGDEFGVVREDLKPVKKSKAAGVEGDDLDTTTRGDGTTDPIPGGPGGDPSNPEGAGGDPTVPPQGGTPPPVKPSDVDKNLLPDDLTGKENKTSTTTVPGPSGKTNPGAGGVNDPANQPTIRVTPATARPGTDLRVVVENVGTNQILGFDMPGADPPTVNGQDAGTFRYGSTGTKRVTLRWRAQDGTAGPPAFADVLISDRDPLAVTSIADFMPTGPHSIGPDGEVIGTRADGGNSVGTVRQPDGGFFDIVSPNGFETRPRAINSQGLVVGSTADGAGLIPLRWDALNGGVLIPEPPGRAAAGAGYTLAVDVNSSGAILLMASIGPGSGQFSYVELYVLAPGSTTYGTPITVPGFRFFNAVLDDQGRVAATIEDTVNGFQRAVWWNAGGGTMNDLAPGNTASVTDMNDNGQVLGWLNGQAVVWNLQGGGAPVQTGFIEADSINNAGIVAGYLGGAPLINGGTPALFDLTRRVQIPLAQANGNICRPNALSDGGVTAGSCGIDPLAQGAIWARHEPGS